MMEKKIDGFQQQQLEDTVAGEGFSCSRSNDR